MVALSPAARAAAVIDDDAVPADILTGNAGSTGEWLEPVGAAAGALEGGARRRLECLVDVYLSRLPAEAEARERSEMVADEVRFAWAGRPGRGQAHYYRLQSPSFLVKLDNTQNGANHVRTVWRQKPATSAPTCSGATTMRTIRPGSMSRPGGVAQLAERYVRNVEVGGSNPLTSTSKVPGAGGV